MAGIKEAGHTEYDPDVSVPLITLASCPVPDRPDNAPLLWGNMKITISSGSLASDIYHQEKVDEPFTCSYELNPAFREKLETPGLKVSGVSEDGGARIIELPGKRFFMGAGFVPQMSSEATNPHPLIVAFLKAASEFNGSRKT